MGMWQEELTNRSGLKDEWLQKIHIANHNIFSKVADCVEARYSASHGATGAVVDQYLLSHLSELGASPEQREVVEDFFLQSLLDESLPGSETGMGVSWLKEIRRPNVP